MVNLPTLIFVSQFFASTQLIASSSENSRDTFFKKYRITKNRTSQQTLILWHFHRITKNRTSHFNNTVSQKIGQQKIGQQRIGQQKTGQL